MRQILVPTDFSDASRGGLQYAVGLANRVQAQLVLFSAFHLPPPPPEVAIVPGSGEYDALEKDTNAALNALAAEVAVHAVHDPEVVAVKGLAADEILRWMTAHRPWLTVMGTHGTTGLQRLVFGSVAAAVTQGATEPLLLVPEETQFGLPTNALFATDFHASDREAVEHLMSWSGRPEDLALTFLHISDGRMPVQFETTHLERFQAQMRDMERTPDMQFERQTHPDTARALQDILEDRDCDLIVLAPVQRNALMRLLLPSVTQQMIPRVKVPIFVFPASDNA